MPRGGKRNGAGRPKKQEELAPALKALEKVEAIVGEVAAKEEAPGLLSDFAAIIRKHIPPEKIAQRVAEGLDAMETKFFQKEGFVMESRDVIAWAERRQYAQLAAELATYHVPVKAADPKQFVNNGIVMIHSVPQPAHESSRPIGD